MDLQTAAVAGILFCKDLCKEVADEGGFFWFVVIIAGLNITSLKTVYCQLQVVWRLAEWLA